LYKLYVTSEQNLNNVILIATLLFLIHLYFAKRYIFITCCQHLVGSHKRSQNIFIIVVLPSTLPLSHNILAHDYNQ